MKLTGRAGHSREKWQKIARKITENRPDFCPGCCAGAVAAVGLPSPAFLYPRRLALCGRLCGAFMGVSGGVVPGAVDCLRLCAAVGGSVACFGACLCPCTLARLRGSVRPLWRLCPPVRRCPGAVALALCPSSRRGLWRDREKPGQAVQAPPGRKRTAAGIAPGAALWFYLFIFNNSDRIANGIIKSTKRTNIFNFHPLKQR